MARETTGTKYKSRGVWYAYITVAQRKRESFAMPSCTTEAQAEERKNIVNDVVQRLRKAGHAALVQRFAKEAGERAGGKPLDKLLSAVNGLCIGTMAPRDLLLDTALYREVGEMWTSGKMDERYPGHGYARKGAKEIARLLEKHVYPHIGELPVGMIRHEHVQEMMRHYPKENDQDSRRNIGKLTNRVMQLAVEPLKLIPSNPLPRGWIPKPGPPKSRTCIYPPEDVQLMGCTEEELGLRLLWGYLHREGHRKEEVFLLTFSDFDLKLGTINLEKNKTKHPRWWVLSPGVAATLRAWKRYREEVLGERITGDSFVFFAIGMKHPGTKAFHAAKEYRRSLLTAGIDRALLHKSGGNHKQVRAHDTRAAFVTTALAAGRSETWIYDRTGHCSLAEMNRYRRDARAFVELNLGDWRPLDQLIPELLPYMAEASPSEPKAASSEPGTSAPASPAAASPAAASPAAASPAASTPAPSPTAPSRDARSLRRSFRAAAEAARGEHPLPVAAAEPAGEAALAVVEERLGAFVAAAAEPVAAAKEGASQPLVAADAEPAGEDGAAVCEVVEALDVGELAAAPDCTADQGGWAAHSEGAGAIVGGIVGVLSVPRLGAGFVGVENQRDLPWIVAVQFPPTIGVKFSSSGTGP